METCSSVLETLGAAVVGGLITGGASLFALRIQHQHALTQQQGQWDHEQQALKEQREADRRQEFERAQREALHELEVLMPSFSQDARAIYEAKQAQRLARSEGKDPPDIAAEIDTHVRQFNNRRYAVIGCVSRIANDKLRRRAGHLYQLNEAMGVGSAEFWRPDVRGKAFGGHDPILVQTDWQEQMLSMLGRLYRGESIDADVVEDNVHQWSRPA